MKVSTFLKGCVLAAALLLVSTEAFAQLPVRTRSLQLLGTTSGTLTQTAGATTTDYTIVWPSNNTAITDGTDAILVGTKTGTTMALGWQQVDSTVLDGVGTQNEIAFFTDPNTLISSPNFTINAGGGSVTVGSGATGGSYIMNSSGAGNNDVTLNTNSTTGGVFNFPTYGAGAGPFNVVATTDIGTVGQIPVVNAAGEVTWEDNPLTGAQRGLADPTDGVYTFNVAVTGDPDLTNDLILVSSVDGGGIGNIYSVTAVGTGTFTVSASGPFTAGERISWLWIAIP